MVIAEGIQAQGKLVFDCVFEREKDYQRENLWILYFDEIGNTKNSLEGPSNMFNLTNKSCMEPILVQLLENYIKKYFLEDSI